MRVLGAAIGNCVHVAGVNSVLALARNLGYETESLGPAVPLGKLVDAIRSFNPDIVALSYRLTPESAAPLLVELKAVLSQNPDLIRPRYLFGGTPPVVALARQMGIFERAFDGTEPTEEVIVALKGGSTVVSKATFGSDLVSRVQDSFPVPLMRHHFGLPNLESTVDGAKRIAEASALDILSIAPDQNAQESFFRPQEMDPRLDGAGGVPIRRPDDLRRIYAASRTGNHPLLRCYSGTRDLVKWGEMLRETIAVAWGAVPLTWYSELDGRSSRPLTEAIAENQQAITWYAENGIPVEVNESHQWALRGCGDTIEVAMAYIAAHNAKKLGVKTYVAQFMFDTPKGISPSMDLAKMMAKMELLRPLEDGVFRVIRMARSGLASFSPDAGVAKGQLASSIYSAMAIKPHIVHVVGFSEADHAATADEIIESCAIASGAIRKSLLGTPCPETDPAVMSRRDALLEDVKLLLGAVKRIGGRGSDDPLTSPEVLWDAVRSGLLDAPDLKGGKVARGAILTKVVNGACVPVDAVSGDPISEEERIKRLVASGEDLDLAEI